MRRKATKREKKVLERKKLEENEGYKMGKMNLGQTFLTKLTYVDFKASVDNSRQQHREINNNECAVCVGAYEDDLNNGELEQEWIHSTNVHSCGKWIHCDCVHKSKDGLYKCNVCSICFV